MVDPQQDIENTRLTYLPPRPSPTFPASETIWLSAPKAQKRPGADRRFPMPQELQSPSSPAETELRTTVPAETPLQGSVLVLIQFDVCEEIKLDQLRQILGARTL